MLDELNFSALEPEEPVQQSRKCPTESPLPSSATGLASGDDQQLPCVGQHSLLLTMALVEVFIAMRRCKIVQCAAGVFKFKMRLKVENQLMGQPGDARRGNVEPMHNGVHLVEQAKHRRRFVSNRNCRRDVTRADRRDPPGTADGRSWFTRTGRGVSRRFDVHGDVSHSEGGRRTPADMPRAAAKPHDRECNRGAERRSPGSARQSPANCDAPRGSWSLARPADKAPPGPVSARPVRIGALINDGIRAASLAMRVYMRRAPLNEFGRPACYYVSQFRAHVARRSRAASRPSGVAKTLTRQLRPGQIYWCVRADPWGTPPWRHPGSAR